MLGYYCRHTIRQRCVQIPVSTRVEDPHNFNADPDLDPTFDFKSDPNPEFHFNARIRIRILLLIEVMRICDHPGLQNLQGSIFRLHASTVSVHGPPRLHFGNLKLLSFDFNADPDPNIAFHSDADPDPVSKKKRIHVDSDPDPQP